MDWRRARPRGAFLLLAVSAAYWRSPSFAPSAPPPRRPSRSLRRAASGELPELFASLRTELSKYTPLESELDLFLSDAERHARPEGLPVLREMLEWLQAKAAEPIRLPSSRGPLASAVLSDGKKEVVLLGTMHGVPGLQPGENTIPAVVEKAIAKLAPDIVAVELDKARGQQELEKLPAELWGKAPMLLPEEDFAGDLSATAGLGLDENVVTKAKSRFAVDAPEALLNAHLDVFAESSEKNIATNLFALAEFRNKKKDDWGKDTSAAVLAAAKCGKPLLLCDLPQEWTLGKVAPLYNSAFAAARSERLEYLRKSADAAAALRAEERILEECVLNNHGGDLPLFNYGLGVCRPAVGLVEAEAKDVWVQERDPFMAKAVTAALEGKARSAAGGAALLKEGKRAVLVVGAAHVEGIAEELKKLGYKLLAKPRGGWAGRVRRAAGDRGRRGRKRR